MQKLKNQNGFSVIEGIIVVIIAVIIVSAGVFAWYRHKQSVASSVATAHDGGSLSGGCVSNDIPGSLTVTVPGSTSKQQIQAVIKPIHGTLATYDTEGLEGISVPVGSETKAIKYLKTQSLIQDAFRSTRLCPD